MAAEAPDGQRGDDGSRRRDLLNVDEFINMVLSKAHSRNGRRAITAACLVVGMAVVAYPIINRSSPAPAAREGDFPTVTISVPSDYNPDNPSTTGSKLHD